MRNRVSYYLYNRACIPGHHLQGVLTLCFAEATKLLKLQFNKISKLKCSRDRC